MERRIKKNPFPVILFLFLVFPVFQITAQTNTGQSTVIFDMTGFPQWSKDMRRWEIVAFGSFPFAMLMTTFVMDSYRWGNENGMSWTEEGRRYAPWPLKSAGAVEMSSREREITFVAAASLSAAIAFTDLIIVQIKRQKERRRIESLPPGTAIIIRRPYPESEEAAEDAAGSGDVSNGADSNATAPGTLDFSFR